MNKIKSISEAFSMQPGTWTVCDQTKHNHYPFCIKEINVFWFDDNTKVYRGYNFNDVLLFEFQAKSVNVFYFTNL